MATTLAPSPQAPTPPELSPEAGPPSRRGREASWSAIVAPIGTVHGAGASRELSQLEREPRWACEWWPPDEQPGRER
jgi:hypothetical protein